MSDRTILVKRKDDPFFEMPQDSLTTLSGHRPVWRKILQYLPMDAKKNLRLSHPGVLKNALLDDPTWIWTINLGAQIQFPHFFYTATTPIRVNFPRNEYSRLINNPENCDQMIEVINKIKHRIVGLAVHQKILDIHRDQFMIEGLQSIEIEGDFFDDINQTALQLLVANFDSLQEIYLKVLKLSDVSHMLKNATFHNVKKLQLMDIKNLCNLLKACPNVQYVSIRGGTINMEDGCILGSVNELQIINIHGDLSNILKAFPNVQNLAVEGGIFDIEDGFRAGNVKTIETNFVKSYCVNDLLTMCQSVKELTVANSGIVIDKVNFSLSHLAKLSLKNVDMTTTAMGILKNKLPLELKLEECMDEHCEVYDMDGIDEF